MSARIYLSFTDPDIKGDVSDPGHVGEIQVLSWSHSFSQPASPVRAAPEGGAVEQANHASLTFSKYHDVASGDLLRCCWSGKQIGKALMSCYRSDAAGAQVRYLDVELAHVIVSNVSISAGVGDLAVENVSLDYGSVTYRYHAETGNAAGVSHDLIQSVVS